MTAAMSIYTQERKSLLQTYPLYLAPFENGGFGLSLLVQFSLSTRSGVLLLNPLVRVNRYARLSQFGFKRCPSAVWCEV